MDSNTAVLERLKDNTTEPLGRPPIPRREPWAVPLLAVAGLLCMGLAGAVQGKADPAAIAAALGGPQVVVSSGAYEADHSSDWHVYPGLHSVVVLTGTLTVYDDRCERHDFGPGEAYVGGDRPHLVRNDTPERATYVVTHARMPSTVLDAEAKVPPSTGCETR